MHRDIAKVLISQSQIATRIRELAERIRADHEGEITIVPVMTGALIFAADLIRHLPMRMKIHLLAVSSYPGQSVRSQGPQLLAQQLGDVRGRHVLLIDDILDSGGTIQAVRQLVLERGAASVRACVLLRKPTPGAGSTPVDYVGFDIPDEFVVGYGLDYDDYYRNLPEIVTLREDLIKGTR